jgi:tagatose-1,6-bisphosphate aldolase non-catalytic subunit AgaZ/GatZ
MSKEARLAYFFEENLSNPFKDDLMVDVTIRDIPARLLKEFMRQVVNDRYTGGISPAIKDLMVIAVQKSKEKHIQLSATSSCAEPGDGGEDRR